ncbi:hypothetical protein N8Z31_00660 [Pelagibacteraceae bacterium]|nr:hypothetical protein [Pelagibacteraceae bacterium]|tara:strand:+ start:293 stop:514 length:222 start_codon:yes stop_codon:yes gene_type:complete
MAKIFFHNYRIIDKNIRIKKSLSILPAKKKITVDINKLLNRVKIDKKNEVKQKFIYLSMTISILAFTGLLISI